MTAQAIANRTYAGARLAPARPVRIALVGPDGVGKSTAIEAVQEWFQANVPEVSVEVRQWRPGLLPDLGRFLGKPPQPQGKNPPRRTSGRFHWLRIFYYLTDFVVGTWWKDFLRAAPSSLIIYDRCALDMFVDPVRFALRSRGGARLISKLTPRMDAVILLHDQPERIVQRKQELARHEMADQLNTWLQLVNAGEVNATIQVDAAAGEISARVLDVVLDTILRKNGTPELPGPGALTWLSEILGSGRYLPLTDARNPRFLIPVSEPRSMARGLEIYNAQAVQARIGKTLLAAGLRLGLAQSVVRSRISFAHVPGGSLLDHLTEKLGSGPLTCAISMGTPNRSQKPVLQLMDARGEIAGYAKIGWNERTIGLAGNEARMLDTVRGAFQTAIVPAVLHAGCFRDLYVLVESAPAVRTRPGPAQLDRRHLQFLMELHRRGESFAPLPWSESSAEVRDTLAHLRDLGFHYHAHLLRTALHKCARAMRGQPIRMGFGHGDFARWNLRIESEKLLVLDWEYGSTEYPPLWDLLHFAIRGGIELEKQNAAAIYRRLTNSSAIEEYCAVLDIPFAHIEPLLASYVSQALSENLQVHGVAPSSKDSQTRATLANLLAIVCRPGDYTA